MFYRVLLFIVFCALGTVALSSFTFRQSVPDETHPFIIQMGNAHDLVWHVALMQALTQHVPPPNLLVSGEQLQGYHYLNDLFWVGVHNLTGISVLRLYMQISPWCLAALFAATTLSLFLLVVRPKSIAYLGAAMVIFGANIAFWVALLWRPSANTQSMFWVDQSVAFGINQQMLLSLSFVNILFFLYVKNRHKWWWLIGLITGVLVGIKIYAAMVLFPVLLVIGLIEAWRMPSSHRWRMLGSVLVGLAVSLPLLYLVGNKNGFPFLWQPGWFLKTMFEAGDRLNFPRWELQRLYSEERHLWWRTIILWTFAFVTFYIGNFGVKILGLFAAPKIIGTLRRARVTVHELFPLFLLGIIVECFSVPLFWLQKGVAWNTIQFLPYTVVPLSLLLVQWVQNRWQKSRQQVLMLVILLLISLPTTVQTMIRNSRTNTYVGYSVETIHAIKDLPSQYPGKELLIGTRGHLNDSSLIPAMTGKSVYWTDGVILMILNDFHQDRQQYILDVEANRVVCTPNQVLIELTEQGRLAVFPCPLLVSPAPVVVANFK